MKAVSVVQTRSLPINLIPTDWHRFNPHINAPRACHLKYLQALLFVETKQPPPSTPFLSWYGSFMRCRGQSARWQAPTRVKTPTEHGGRIFGTVTPRQDPKKMVHSTMKYFSFSSVNPGRRVKNSNLILQYMWCVMVRCIF